MTSYLEAYYKVLTLSCSIFLGFTLLPIFYPVNLQHSSCKHEFSVRVEKLWILDLQCVQKEG